MSATNGKNGHAIETATLTLDGVEVSFTPGQSLYEVTQAHAKDVPTLCYDERLEAFGACRLCAVEVEAIRSATSGIRSEYASKMDDMMARQAQEIDAFDEAKSTALGHARNAWAAFKTRAWMNEIRTKPLEAMKHGFALAFSSGLQQQDIEAQHQKEQDAMTAERRSAERDAAREARMDEGFRLDDLRQNYHEQRGDLVFKHGMDAAKMKTEWRQLDHDRLASEAEDYRRQAPDADQDGSGSDGGKKPDRQIEDPAPDLAQDFEPANDNAYDVPIDELREIDAIRRQQLDWVNDEWDSSPEHESNDQDFDRE